METIDNQFNFYHLRGSIADNANVSQIYDGNFYSSLAVLNGKENIVKPLYDRELVFGKNLTLQAPDAFHSESISSLIEKEQIPVNKVSGGFTALADKLAPGRSFVLCL